MKSVKSLFLIKCAEIFEKVLAGIILAGILVAGVKLAIDLGIGVYDWGRTGVYAIEFKTLLASAIQLIIGIEFVRMLSNHSATGAIEVVLFVIAKSIIVGDYTSLEMLLGVASIALLFVIRKFLLTKTSRLDEGIFFSADASVDEVCRQCKVHIPDVLGKTLNEVVINEFARLGRTVKEREKLVLEDVSIMIYEMENDKIVQFEVWNRKERG
ncbi:MAG: hypothetical protein IKU84_04075 [Clostridia bacterium]|nr:hypothetical protein [Clostridia bacterium]